MARRSTINYLKPNVVIGQVLLVNGRKCEVIYIHPEGLFYIVQFTNGIRETINRWEFKKVLKNRKIYIPWTDGLFRWACKRT